MWYDGAGDEIGGQGEDIAESYGNYGDVTGSGADTAGSAGSGWSKLLDNTIPSLINAWVQHDQTELQAQRYSETDDPAYKYPVAPTSPASNQTMLLVGGAVLLVLVVLLARK